MQQQQNPIDLAVLVGSVREGRFGPVVAEWLLGRLAGRDEFKVEVIDLAEFTLPATLDGSGDAADFAARIDRAAAFVIVTPEYNHGYPGGLKTAIDTARVEWFAKPVAFVSYGGTAGGLRSVEQLKPVFAELNAVAVRHTVSFHWAEDQFDERGTLREPERANRAADELLKQLSWWANALRAAREERTFGG
ncbi:NADPH-dependent FMN reductase [Rhizomonospora bruguierae]|uniref:NADPH-dependent FMN reductase n=1 Tax=Rhizomonospora bruguierae TaxID=1581705 RepID=UPI001BCC6AA1|nr:NAD(P)H-dependent oxidoreductase [Micromonospora sp. NBRC 107566]